MKCIGRCVKYKNVKMMQLKMKWFTVTLCTGALVVSLDSCSSDDASSTITCDGTSVSFATDVSPIIKTSCAITQVVMEMAAVMGLANC
jgi:hypothetical protein